MEYFKYILLLHQILYFNNAWCHLQYRWNDKENYSYTYTSGFRASFCSERVNDTCFTTLTCTNIPSSRSQNVYYGYTYSFKTVSCRHNLFTMNFVKSNSEFPLHIKFTFDDEHSITEHFHLYRQDLARLTVAMDLQQCSIKTMPVFPTMSNLQSLNLSGNKLVIAKLWNVNDLPSLKIFDLSHNSIATIETRKTCYQGLTEINLSFNQIISIEQGVFKIFGNLQNLDLSHNNVMNLDLETFEGLGNLLYLNLSYNEITDINTSMLRFNKLLELQLSHNKIKSLNANNFEKLQSLEVLSLESNNIIKIEKDVIINLKSLTYLNLSFNQLVSIDKEAFENISSLVEIYLDNNQIQTLHTEMFKNSKVTAFTVNNNSLDGSLQTNTFLGLTGVISLDLSYQKLSAVEDSAFVGLNNLEELQLNNNQIQNVSTDSFSGLDKLNKLDLSYNRIMDIKFKMKYCKNLKWLQLSHNLLTQISENSFEGLTQLQYLQLSYNKINYTAQNSFKSLNNLRDIDISNNPLSYIEPGLFTSLKSVLYLNLYNNSLVLIKNGLFEGMLELKEVNISHGNIEEIEFNAFPNIEKLEKIDLSYNKLKEYKANITIEMGNSTNTSNSLISSSGSQLSLILSHNNLSSIDIDLKRIHDIDLSYNPGLKFNAFLITHAVLNTLDLSGTLNEVNFQHTNATVSQFLMSYVSLSNVSSLGLGHLKHMTALTLSNNNISDIKAHDFKNLTDLLSIDISFNNIMYIQPGSFVDNEQLLLLNVSHNMLTTISYGVLRGLNSLNILDISYNRIGDLEKEKFYDVKNLQKLIVDHNNIKLIDPDEVPSVLELSIGDNPLSCKVLTKIILLKRLRVTAINLDYTNHEHIDGISCNKVHAWVDGETSINKTNNHENDEVLESLKGILSDLFGINKKTDSLLLNEVTLLKNEVKDIKNNMEILRHESNNSSTANVNILSKLVNISSNNYENQAVLESLKNILRNLSNANIDAKDFTLLNKIDSIEKILTNEVNISSNATRLLDKISKSLMGLRPMKKSLESKQSLENKSSMLYIDNALSSDPSRLSHSNIFTEICLGFIAVLLLLQLLYKLYNLTVLRNRSRVGYSSHLLNVIDHPST